MCALERQPSRTYQHGYAAQSAAVNCTRSSRGDLTAEEYRCKLIRGWGWEPR